MQCLLTRQNGMHNELLNVINYIEHSQGTQLCRHLSSECHRKLIWIYSLDALISNVSEWDFIKIWIADFPLNHRRWPCTFSFFFSEHWIVRHVCVVAPHTHTHLMKLWCKNTKLPGKLLLTYKYIMYNKIKWN